MSREHLSPNSGWATLIIILSVLAGAAAVIGGLVLAFYTTQSCVADPTTFEQTCSEGGTHLGLGIGIAVGGAVQALFVGSFAALHQEIRYLRIVVADIAEDIEDLG